jgi:cytochrome c oxidase assembly protein subunit 15
MTHRYLAASLGLLIVGIAIFARRLRSERCSAPAVAMALVGVVIFQGLLGKWTVTLLLKPAIVTAHLLGGLTILALLAWLTLRAHRARRIPVPRGVLVTARLGLLLLVAQVVLGGWTSTNYAALACAEFPACQGSFWPAADYANAFHVVRELGMTADGDVLPLAALTAIHWSHRLGALIAGAVLYLLGWALSRRRATQGAGFALLAVLTLQLGLGVANVVFDLPLVLAVAHNAGAVLLVALMVSINYRVRGIRAEVMVGGRKYERPEHQSSYA